MSSHDPIYKELVGSMSVLDKVGSATDAWAKADIAPMPAPPATRCRNRRTT
jgi:hypothetical protein